MVSRPYQQAACHDARNQQTPDTAQFFLRARFVRSDRAANRAEIGQASFAPWQSCTQSEERSDHPASFAGAANFSRQILPCDAYERCKEVRNLSSILSKCQSI
jgi:hypothetical protein